MDLSNFVTYDKKESLLLGIAKPNQEIVENTHSKPQETLEFKITKQKESFSFDVPLHLNAKKRRCEYTIRFMMFLKRITNYKFFSNMNNSMHLNLTLE